MTNRSSGYITCDCALIDSDSGATVAVLASLTLVSVKSIGEEIRTIANQGAAERSDLRARRIQSDLDKAISAWAFQHGHNFGVVGLTCTLPASICSLSKFWHALYTSSIYITKTPPARWEQACTKAKAPAAVRSVMQLLV